MIYHFYLKEQKSKKDEVKKLVASLLNKREYVIHVRNLRQVHRVIKFSQKA